MFEVPDVDFIRNCGVVVFAMFYKPVWPSLVVNVIVVVCSLCVSYVCVCLCCVFYV